MRRICKKCSVEKDASEFVASPKCLHGISWRCKSCNSAAHKRRNEQRNPIDLRPREIARRLFDDGFRKCLGCDEVKPLENFWKNSRWPNGYKTRCKSCCSAAFKAWSAKNKEHLADYNKEYIRTDQVKARRLVNKRSRASDSPKSVMQVTLRHGLHRRPTVNPATIDDLMEMFTRQGGLCAVTGLKMTWAQGKVLPTSISLDRIDPNGGYSAVNLRLVCQSVNAFRGRMTDDEMFHMALAIVTNMKKPKLRLVS